MAGIIAHDTVRLGPIGSCIYCGSTEGRLTDEHIVPKGLGGTLILEKSSCDACAEVTSKVEHRVMRGFLDHGRQAMGIKGRKSHRRVLPSEVAQTLVRSDERLEVVDVPSVDAIKLMHLPVFAAPAFLTPQSPPRFPREDLNVVAIDTATFGLEGNKVFREHKAKGVHFEDKMDVWAFVRMLAKIAHGHHVAVRGLFPLEESPLLPIILGKSPDAANWIGNTEHDPLPARGNVLHLLQDVSAEEDSRATMVRIKLFAMLNAPTYALATRIPSEGLHEKFRT